MGRIFSWSRRCHTAGHPPALESAVQNDRQVTVSIVSHRQGDLVRALLADLDAVSGHSIAKAVITINTAEPQLTLNDGYRFPIHIIRNTEPKGFGANHNAAFQQCGTDWFLVLNPDLRFSTDPIAPLLAQADPATGLLAPRVIEPGKQAPEPHRRLLTPAELILRRMRPPAVLAKPDWVAGMFMLFRASAFRQVAGFDPRYFMYVEDADICARLKLAGWQLCAVDSVRVTHDARRASWRDRRALIWHVTSLLKWWLSPAFWRAFATRHGR